MKMEVSKTNQDFAFLKQRLGQIQMSGHERQIAEARFAQAEAIADAIFAAAHGVARLFKRLTARPAHPAAPASPSAG